MDIILLAVIAGVIVILAVFLIPMILEMRRTVVALRLTMEQKLNPALEELRVTLQNVQSIADNLNAITGDVRHVSGAIHHVGDKLNAVNAVVDAVSSSLTARTLSLKAGISAALSYFIAHAVRKGDRT